MWEKEQRWEADFKNGGGWGGVGMGGQESGERENFNSGVKT